MITITVKLDKRAITNTNEDLEKYPTARDTNNSLF